MEYLKYFTLLVVVSILSTTEATFSNDELNKTNSKSTGTLTEVVNTALGR